MKGKLSPQIGSKEICDVLEEGKEKRGIEREQCHFTFYIRVSKNSGPSVAFTNVPQVRLSTQIRTIKAGVSGFGKIILKTDCIKKNMLGTSSSEGLSVHVDLLSADQTSPTSVQPLEIH